MNASVFENYLHDIEGYIIDENKIVTYKLLSKYLDVNINTAKQLLYSFATQQGNKVHSTYLVSGQLKNNNGNSVQIVREEDLEKIKETFTTVTSEHVYSVQKVKALKDLAVLYSVDAHRKDETEIAKRLGNIKCNSPVIRAREEVSMLKKISQSANVEGKDKQWPTAKKQVISGSSPKDVPCAENKAEAGKNKEAAVPNEENDVKSKPKKGGIAAMFAVQSTKNKKQDEANLKTKDVANKKQKTENGISTFFSRQVNNQKLEQKCTSEESSQDVNSKVECIADNDAKEEKKSEMLIAKERTPKAAKPVENKSKKKKNSSNKSKKRTESPPKKRKRIMVMSDSEESGDDDQAKEEEEDEVMCCSPPPQPQVPESDGEEIIAPTPEAGLKKGRKRIRKLVDKTYMDDDGYMLTCKEYVTESCSGSEPEEDKEKENKLKKTDEQSEKSLPKTKGNKDMPSKDKTSPQKTKQASIMNFFKKK
ncbi:DNA polymerase delta subunit 3 [Blattella germanica]|nr:DNA polymerase delta subunit 3 [Blattella germanica]